MKMNTKKKLWSAEFTLAIGCRLNCYYCPQSKLIMKYKKLFPNAPMQMSFSDFKTILRHVEPGAGIAFAGMVEPFLNKDCSKMIRYAYKQGYKIHLDTTLQGATVEDAYSLKDVKFNGIQLHLPDSAMNAKFDFSGEWLKVFQIFNNRKDTEAYHCHGNVHPIIADMLKKERVFSNSLMNRAGNLIYEELATYKHTGHIVCHNGSLTVFGGWTPNILPNGTVLLCCMDYGMNHMLGNLLRQSWDDITQMKPYAQVEKGMDDDTIPSLCRTCSAATDRKKSEKICELNLRGPNAVWTAHHIWQDGIMLSDKQSKIANQIRMASHRCVFGLGNLFSDNYFISGWHNVIRADIFSDNDCSKWGNKYRGIICVPPEELKKYKDLLVIIYTKNDSTIREQLNKINVYNIINIYDIFNMRDMV